MASHIQLHAVLSADVVNSTKMKRRVEKALFASLDEIFADIPFAFYRGDSFQAYLEDPTEALRVALRCRVSAMSLSDKMDSEPTDIRVSIGLGSVEGPIKEPGKGKGTAFVLSGRALDDIQSSGLRLAIVIENPLANEAFRILSAYLNSIFDEMTSKQAHIIEGMLEDQTIQAIADQLGKSKSTVHQLTVSGRWREIEDLISSYHNLLSLLI